MEDETKNEKRGNMKFKMLEMKWDEEKNVQKIEIRKNEKGLKMKLKHF